MVEGMPETGESDDGQHANRAVEVPPYLLSKRCSATEGHWTPRRAGPLHKAPIVGRGERQRGEVRFGSRGKHRAATVHNHRYELKLTGASTIGHGERVARSGRDRKSVV